MAKVISQLPSGGNAPKHNNLLGLNEGDYIHLTQFEKAKLDGIQSGAEVNVNADWNAISGDAQILNKPASFPPSTHTHTISEVVNLENELNGKASTNALNYLQLNKEDKANKQDSLDTDITGTKYPTVTAVKNAIDSIYQPDTVIRYTAPTRVGNTFTFPSGGYDVLLSKQFHTNVSQLETTIAAATDGFKRIDLIYYKADDTIAKIEGDESTTVAIRPDVPAGGVGLCFINIFGATIEAPTPIDNTISLQDSLGVEKFKITDYLRFRGVSFNVGAKQIEIDPVLPLSVFLDTVNGDDNLAILGNINKPFKTLEKVFSSLPVTTSETYTIYLMSLTVNVLRKIPIRNINWVSYTGTTIDFTNCLEDDGITHSQNVLVNNAGPERVWNFVNSNISLKCTYVGKKAFQMGGAEDSGISIFGNIDVFDWQSLGGVSFNGVFCPRSGSDFIINTMYDSPQNNTAFFLSGALKYSRIRIKNLNVNYVRYLTRTFVGDFIIENIIQVGTASQSWTMHQGLNSNINLGFKNIAFNGSITPKVNTLTFDNSVLSSTCQISLSGTLNITGNILSSTLSLIDGFVNANKTFKNFTGKVDSLQLRGGETLTFNNCDMIVNDWLVSRETSATLLNCLFFKGSNTINRTNPTSLGLFRAHQSNNQNLVMPINCTISGNLKTNSQTFGKDIAVIYSDATFKEKLNEVVIRSKIDLINRTLNSSTTYIIDGIITLATGEYIQVPLGGLTLVGYGFDVSQINKNVAGQSIFTSPAGNSGNFVTRDIQYNSGLGSVFNITSSNGTQAIEMNDVNFQSCSSLGTFTGYRQFTGTTCGFYGCSDGFTLEGTWNGFKITNSNVIGFGSSGTFIKKGASTTFNNRLYIDLNMSVATGSKICDFQDSNFASNKLLQVVNCLVKVNGVIDPNTTSATFPNISPFSLKAYFTNNIGVKNSFNEPYGLKTTNLSNYANDAAAASGGVEVGEVYVETSTGYFKTRLT